MVFTDLNGLEQTANNKVMKNSKATFAIAFVTILLIGITAWVTARSERMEEQVENMDKDIITAIESGDAAQLGALCMDRASFYSPEGSSNGGKDEVTQEILAFFKEHPFKRFARERVLQGNQAGVSYLTGTLFTKNQDYALYATIFNDRIEQLDLSSAE